MLSSKQISLLQAEGFRFIGDGMYEYRDSNRTEIITDFDNELLWDCYEHDDTQPEDFRMFQSFDKLYAFIKDLTREL